jgi:integrase
MKLTTKYVENVRPDEARREIADGGCAGLYLLLQPSGHRSWAVRYRVGGRSAKLTIGSWPEVSLLDARVAAAAARKRVKQGEDPAAAKQDDKIRADAARENTITAVCENYMAMEAKKLRTAGQRRSILNRLIYPALGAMPIETVKRSDIVRLLDKIESGAGPRMADVTLGVLRRIFHWHETRTDDWRSPVIRGMGSRQNTVEHRRTRILDDDEIRAVWQATEDNTPFSALVRFALLTSARRSEIAGMKRDEVDASGIWRLPPSRSKTKVEVVRPLSKAALAVLDGMPRIDGCDFIFTSNGITPINSFGDPKRLLDKRSGVTGWRLHDLRRSARSLLSRIGVNSDTAEKCLGHSRGDIIERYDQHKYIDEMQRAFEALATTIEHIVNPPEGAVIPMRRR